MICYKCVMKQVDVLHCFIYLLSSLASDVFCIYNKLTKNKAKPQCGHQMKIT